MARYDWEQSGNPFMGLGEALAALNPGSRRERNLIQGYPLTGNEAIDRIQKERMLRPPPPLNETPADPYLLPGGGLGYEAHHEQSETVQTPAGEWVNVYGRATPKAGQQLPGTPSYPTVEEAVEAAKGRSQEHGRRRHGPQR